MLTTNLNYSTFCLLFKNFTSYKLIFSSIIFIDCLKFEIKQYKIDDFHIQGMIVIYRCISHKKEMVRCELIPLTSQGIDFIGQFDICLYDICFSFENDYILPEMGVRFYNEQFKIPNHEITCTSHYIKFVKIPLDYIEYTIELSKKKIMEEKCLHVQVNDPYYGDKVCENCGLINPELTFQSYQYFDKRNQINEDYTIYDPDKRFIDLLYGYLYGYNYKDLHEHHILLLNECKHYFSDQMKFPLPWKKIYNFFADMSGKSKIFGGIGDYSYLWLYFPYHMGIRLEDDHVDPCYYFIQVNKRRKGNRMNNLYVIWKSFKLANRNYEWIPMKLSLKSMKDNEYRWNDIFGN